MNIYFIILLSLWLLSLGISLAEHGKRKQGKTDFIASFISFAVILFLTVKAIEKGF